MACHPKKNSIPTPLASGESTVVPADGLSDTPELVGFKIDAERIWCWEKTNDTFAIHRQVHFGRINTTVDVSAAASKNSTYFATTVNPINSPSVMQYCLRHYAPTKAQYSDPSMHRVDTRKQQANLEYLRPNKVFKRPHNIDNNIQSPKN
jgi:hypothetical protein